eukprot:7647685-Lingulodinium_polyedra.AAC.1
MGTPWNALDKPGARPGQTRNGPEKRGDLEDALGHPGGNAGDAPRAARETPSRRPGRTQERP